MLFYSRTLIRRCLELHQQLITKRSGKSGMDESPMATDIVHQHMFTATGVIGYADLTEY